MTTLPYKETLNMIKDTLVEQGFITGIFVYGSFAKGDFSPESELNLFIIVSEDNYIAKAKSVVDAISFSTHYSIKPVIWSINELEKPDNALVQLIFREGKLIYWNSLHDFCASQVFKVRPHTIFTFELSNLEQTTKVRFNYQLYGKKSTRGLLKCVEGKRLTKSCFYVPFGNKFKIIRLFDKFGIQYECKECWI